jgi:hypothetical protein
MSPARPNATATAELRTHFERRELLEKLDDYRDFAIPFVCVIDPRSRLGRTYSLDNGYNMQRGLHTKNPDIELR